MAIVYAPPVTGSGDELLLDRGKPRWKMECNTGSNTVRRFEPVVAKA